MADRFNQVQSVERALSILEALANGNRKGLGVTRLAQKTGLHKSTVHRLIGTLLSKGYIEKDLESDNYKLGMKILLLGSAILDNMDLRTIARPYIQKLLNITKETVHLSVLDKYEAVYIDKFESPDSRIRLNSQIGKRVPLHCTAVGKILLLGYGGEELQEYVERKGLNKFTKNTITTLEELNRELATVATNGYAIDDVEFEEGIRCVAAPIYDRTGNIIAALSVSGPVINVTTKRLPYIIEVLVAHAKEISYQLGKNN